jgi:hypothetical protein
MPVSSAPSRHHRRFALKLKCGHCDLAAAKGAKPSRPSFDLPEFVLRAWAIAATTKPGT